MPFRDNPLFLLAYYLFSIPYIARWEKPAGPTNYKIYTGLVDGDTPLVNVAHDLDDGDLIPDLGFIKKGSTVTPYYSFDDGATKEFLNIDGSSRIDVSDLVAGTDTLDLGFFVGANKNVDLAEFFIEDFMVLGDDVNIVVP